MFKDVLQIIFSNKQTKNRVSELLINKVSVCNYFKK